MNQLLFRGDLGSRGSEDVCGGWGGGRGAGVYAWEGVVSSLLKWDAPGVKLTGP